MTSNNNASIFVAPEFTRLVTIAAHVDHGKTTLSDNLVEYNGLISERLAGTLRYLDAHPDEQRRGITIHSSAVGLSHAYQAPPRNKQAAAPSSENANTFPTPAPSGSYIIHLVDSPGHTDFSWQVTSSFVACDACLLLVDAVEGMGPRTHQVIRETMQQQLIPILVINKMDRLCTDLHLDPTEAYIRLRALVESVNAAAAAMLASCQADALDSNGTTTDAPVDDTENDFTTQIWTFDPSRGNVVFASALYGWGFTAASLARSLVRSKTIPVKPAVLRNFIFGDYKVAWNNGEVKVLKWQADQASSAPPLFAQYALEPLWDIYHGVQQGGGGGLSASSYSSTPATNTTTSVKINAHSPGMDQVLQALQTGATTSAKAQTSNSATAETPQQQIAQKLPNTTAELDQLLTRTVSNTAESILRTLLRRYRPLATTLLDVICDYAPSPRHASSNVRSHILRLQEPRPAVPQSPPVASHPEWWHHLQTSVQSCKADADAPCVAQVCKFFAAERSHVRDPSFSLADDDDKNATLILGLVRVLSGQLRTNQEYYLVGPQQSKSDTTTTTTTTPQDSPSPVPPKRTVRVYLLMGSSLVLVDHVPAGHLCAVLNLQDAHLKTLTLTDSFPATPLQAASSSSLSSQGAAMKPLVKVCIEAKDAADTAVLEYGLEQLTLADAAVEVSTTARGERLLACLGELHLEQSIRDLERVYCGRDMIDKIQWSDPIVDFGETTEWFEEELSAEYRVVWDRFQSASPLRQVMMPPYREEEGLAGAHRGRARAVVSGRSAAIYLRVVPLAPCVYQALQHMKAVSVGSRAVKESDELIEETQKLSRALGLSRKIGSTENSQILQAIAENICTMDSNGNAMLETPHLKEGTTTIGFISLHGEIYQPRSTSAASEPEDPNNRGDRQDDEDVTEMDSSRIAREHYELVKERLRRPSDEKDPIIERNDLSTNTQCLVAAREIWLKNKGSATAGFQLAMRSGPICEEPVRNVLVVLEGFEVALREENVKDEDSTGTTAALVPAKPLSSGMVVSALRSGIRCSLLTRPARLMEGYLRLTLNSSLQGIGALYSVLSKRRGRVLDDSMVEGTDLLLITALIPQAEAFGLAPELFGKTSGEVTAPEMIFSHWERLDVDPFWIPSTEEEREDYGELQVAGDSSTGMDNTAVKYIRKVRTQKGLQIDSSRTVIAAEKQRTLKR